MWILPKIDRELVTITLNSAAISCAWIRSRNHTTHELVAYTRVPLERLEYEQSILFNPTALKKIIASFLQTHALHNAWVFMSVSGPGIVESIVDIPTASPTADDFKFPKLKTLVWDYRYLYCKDNAHSAFYVCGMSRSLLCQYKLLAITSSLNLIGVTTERMALLYLYKKQYGSAFRHSQLARDMEQHHNDIHTLFTTESLRRMITIKHPLNIEEEKSWLLIALALYTVGKDTDETN